MVNRQTPQWCEEMKKSLLAMAGGLEKRECLANTMPNHAKSRHPEDRMAGLLD